MLLVRLPRPAAAAAAAAAAARVLGSATRTRQLSGTPRRLSKASKARALKPRAAKTDAPRGPGVAVYGHDEAPLRAEAPAKGVHDASASAGIGEVDDERYSVPAPVDPSGHRADAHRLPAQAPRIEPPSTGSPSDNYGPETEFYTSVPPYNVPLVLTASFVITLFCVVGADTARVGWTERDEETGGYRLAPAWQRWTYALGMGGVGIGAALWGALAPSRVITRMTIARPLGALSRFPPTARVTLHTPVSKLPLYPRRTILLASIHLLGPLSTSPKPWHPKAYVAPTKPPRTGVLADAWRRLKETLVAEPKNPKSSRRPKSTAGLSHVPILIEGDRFSYSLQKTRGERGGDKGAWCEDWEGLERAWLGVRE